MIVYYLLDATDLEKLVKINKLIRVVIIKDTIFNGGNDTHSLGVVHGKEFWLSRQGDDELYNGADHLSVNVYHH